MAGALVAANGGEFVEALGGTVSSGARDGRLGGRGAVLGERGELVARARDDALELADEVGVDRVVGRFERFHGPFTRRDQDSKQRDLLAFSADTPASRQ